MLLPRRSLWLILVCVADLMRLPASASAAETKRFALSMFHFNIQYVAGGLEGFVPGLPADSPEVKAWEIDDEAVEDGIVTQSFEPILDVYLAHPTWGVDLELQGYFLDVLAARHPAVLEKLRRLATSGQAEVISFHYSDQLFLAFPREDWERSQALTRATFERHGIPLGTSVFAQEGQAGFGMAQAMADKGYEVLVWPKNLFTYQHGEFDAEPYYRIGDVDMIAGAKGVRKVVPGNAGDVEVVVDWTFFDDGEKLATGDVDPYITAKFTYKPGAVARYEQSLAGLEAQGYSISTVGRYVDQLRTLGVQPVTAPPLLDGTWQPNSTDGTRKWLGGVGIWGDQERDNDVRSLQSLTHRELVAAETASQQAASDRDGLDEAWRLLSLSEVSDASGINPYRGEVEYGLVHATEALRLASEAIDRAKHKLDAGTIRVNVSTASVQTNPPAEAAPPVVAAPIAIQVDGGGRNSRSTWTQAASNAWRVEIQFDPGSAAAAKKLAVTFPGNAENIVYCPGLTEDEPLSLPRSAFSFDHFQMPLANGLIALTDGRFVIKDTARVHVAATLKSDSRDVMFSDDTSSIADQVTWVFHVFDGSLDEAVKYANHLNVRPAVTR